MTNNETGLIPGEAEKEQIENMGIQERMIKLIQELISERCIKVKVEGTVPLIK